jgi:hypothetical protein
VVAAAGGWGCRSSSSSGCSGSEGLLQETRGIRFGAQVEWMRMMNHTQWQPEGTAAAARLRTMTGCWADGEVVGRPVLGFSTIGLQTRVAAPLGYVGWPHSTAKTMPAIMRVLVGLQRALSQRARGSTCASCIPNHGGWGIVLAVILTSNTGWIWFVGWEEGEQLVIGCAGWGGTGGPTCRGRLFRERREKARRDVRL